MTKNYSKAAAATFVLNKGEAIHRWYSYLEGYSSCLIDDVMQEIGIENIHSIYDPFCGTGTTALVASSLGIKSYYSETNPFMQKVIESKINCVKRLRDSGVKSRHLCLFLATIENLNTTLRIEATTWDGFEKYFEEDVLHQIQELLAEVDKITDEDSRTIAMVILGSIIVQVSKMKRQGDLRYAKENEKSDSDRDVFEIFIKKIKDAIFDMESENCVTLADTVLVSDDARDSKLENIVDCVITSPPYLNGTNYIRNTKLELKLSGFIETEKDLPAFHSKGIMAGINNVSKRTTGFTIPDCVKPYLEQLEPVSYDSRIPIMVAGYFHDMTRVIERLSHAIKDNGYFIMDIGDSQFAGVHIPTHEILTQICENYGFKLYADEILRERRSKNGMVLSQRLLKFRLSKTTTAEDSFRFEAQCFIKNMPYKTEPYSGRNWGHPWHSLCSYHGKLKPAIAHFMIEQFTDIGQTVLDPLCGVGTIPLEACLQGRVGIGNDLSEMAYIVTKAKLEKTTIKEVLDAVAVLERYIHENANSETISEDAIAYESFGFNGKISTYFHPDTYREVLSVRRFFKGRIETISVAESMVLSCFLHVLHGNRPYALSRNSHPLTPYAPKGDYIYKNVIKHIREKIELSYKKGDFTQYVNGQSIFGAYEKLVDKNILVDAIICSPPFADSIKFYMQNWMRLWICGWEPNDYKGAEQLFLDQKQKKDFDVYKSFFEMCNLVLKPKGKIVLHLGKTDKVDMAEELSKRAEPYFYEVYRGSESVQTIEKHGIKDKGATVEHQYLFLMKK